MTAIRVVSVHGLCITVRGEEARSAVSNRHANEGRFETDAAHPPHRERAPATRHKSLVQPKLLLES
jgi:hypothetical protein